MFLILFHVLNQFLKRKFVTSMHDSLQKKLYSRKTLSHMGENQTLKMYMHKCNRSSVTYRQAFISGLSLHDAVPLIIRQEKTD